MTRSLILLSLVLISCVGPLKPRADVTPQLTVEGEINETIETAQIADTADEPAVSRDCEVLRAFWPGDPSEALSRGTAEGQLHLLADALTPQQLEEMRSSAAAAAGVSPMPCAWSEQAPPPYMGWISFTPPLYTDDGEFAAFIVIHSPEPMASQASMCLMRNVDSGWQRESCRMFYIS